MDAVQGVCGEGLEESPGADALLRSLVAHSLVQIDGDPASARYRLLESTKSFAFERLEEEAELETMQRARATYLRDFIEHAHENRGTVKVDEFSGDVARRYQDFRAAMQWALADAEDVVLGASIATGLYVYWSHRGWGDGREWIERVVATGRATVGDKNWARAFFGLATMHFALGDYASMSEAAQTADEAYIALGDVDGQARARNILAVAAHASGRLEEAAGLYESLIELSGESGNPVLRVFAWRWQTSARS